MPRGGQAWHGQVIKTHAINGGGSYEYRRVTWEGQPRIAFRWNRGGEIVDCPPGKRTSVTLPVELYPAIIENILPPNVRDETRAFLGPVLSSGNYPNAEPPNPNENYHHPQDVTSPKTPPRDFLGPFRVVLNNGPGDSAYMIGWWGREGQRSRVIGFRWNGTDADPRGFPIARDNPIWVILPLGCGFGHPGPFIDILPPDIRPLVIGFLNGELELP